MALRLGDEAPNFEADTTEGHINFHDWLGDSWGVLFSHPKAFTPARPTDAAPQAPRAHPHGDRPGGRPRGEQRGLGAGHRGDPGHGPGLPGDLRRGFLDLEGL